MGNIPLLGILLSRLSVMKEQYITLSETRQIPHLRKGKSGIGPEKRREKAPRG